MSVPPRFSAAFAVAFAAVLVMAVGGCAGQDQPPGPAGPSSPGHDDVVSSGPQPPVTTTPEANEVVPEPAVGLAAVRWDRVEPVLGAPELLVHGTLQGGPPCAVLSRVDVAETVSAVTVTVWVGRRPEAACDGPQPELGYPYVTRVRLEAPLGRREVRDGAS
jgi:hypothetical protein